MRHTFTFPQLSFLRYRAYRPFYNEGGEGGEGGEGSGGEGSGDGSGEGGEQQWNGKFTKEQQEVIDRQFNKRFGKEKEKTEKLVTQLKQYQDSAELKGEQADQLQSQIDELENSMLTKDETAAKAKTALEKKHAAALKSSQEETGLWQNRFTDSTIDRALTDAAVETGAESAQQLRMMFRGSTSLIEDKDEDGKALGTFTPHLAFTGKDDEGNSTDLTLPVGKAIAKIKEDGLNANLFKHGATGGTGSNPGGQGGQSGGAGTMPTRDKFPAGAAGDVAYGKAYQQYRDAYNADGTKREKATNFAS